MNAYSAITAAEAGLSPLEWQAVTIGMRDADSGIRAAGGQGMLAWVAAMFAGQRPVKPLADARLEAWRRFGHAVRRTRGRITDGVAAPLLAIGVAMPQLTHVASRALL